MLLRWYAKQCKVSTRDQKTFLRETLYSKSSCLTKRSFMRMTSFSHRRSTVGGRGRKSFLPQHSSIIAPCIVLAGESAINPSSPRHSCHGPISFHSFSHSTTTTTIDVWWRWNDTAISGHCTSETSRLFDESFFLSLTQYHIHAMSKTSAVFS